MFLNKIKKLFVGGEWGIAYKKIIDDDYHVIQLPKGYWAADPMLFEYKGQHYLFAEIYINKQKRAGIGYFHFVDGTPVYKGLIIENNYHMSYPCVFEFESSVYMIPETSANNSLEIYKAIDFPKKWTRIADIMVDCSLVDTTVYSTNNTVYLLSYQKINTHWELLSMILNMENFKAKEISRLQFNKNIGRPAGYLFKKDELLLRPAQDCGEKYGESILFYKVDSIAPHEETLIKKISVSDLKLPTKAQRTHTYGEDSLYQVVDFFVEKFELFHALDIYKRSHYKKAK